MLTKKPNFDKWQKSLKTNKLPLLANEIISDIVTRTQSGKDVNNRSFKKYTADYKKKKEKTFGTKVNLTAEGKMLNAITWKKLRNGVRLYFSSREQLVKAKGNQKKRKFFGLDTQQKKRIAKELRKLMRF